MIINAGQVRSAFLSDNFKLKIFFINCAIFLARAIFKPGFIV